MVKVRTTDDNYNNYFYQDDAHKIEGDNHRQEVVFDKGGVATGLSKTQASPTINPEARQRQRRVLSRLTARFLGSGGRVTLCPPGEPPRFRFGKFKSPSPLRGMASTSDLSQQRWHGPILDARTERELIRKAKSGDEPAKQKLLETFHRLVLSIASKHSGPPFNDLMAAGSLGFVEAVGRFNENRGYRLSTYARHWIEKYVRLAVKDWRREGAAGETRQDRHIFSNPNATAEEVVAAVGGTVADAEQAIARLDVGHESYDTGEAAFDDDGNYTGPQVATSHEMALTYGCFSRFHWSPQLVVFELTSRWIDDLAQYHLVVGRRRLDEVGRRRYADELVARERVWISYRSKEGRYRYQTESDIKERAQIAAQMDSPVYFFEQLPNKPATATVQQYELDARIIREKIVRLKALRLAQPQPPKQSKPKRKKWPDTPATTRRGNSSHSPSLPTSPVPHVEFAKKIFGASHICAEPHCSAI
jgi:hypothetical protein